MTLVLEFAAADARPHREAVLRQLDVPAGAALAEGVEPAWAEAAELLAGCAAPAGVLAEISAEEFGEVYRGEGRNDPLTPVGEILGRADRLALFAVTLGEGVTQALATCFAGDDFACACILDAMASVAAEGVADAAERRYEALLREGGWAAREGAVLRYSPGYCGWDITGQRKLFARLEPARVGITLSDSCLMRPLKSVSGVMIAGPREIHMFAPGYDACGRCANRTCTERQRSLAGPDRSDNRGDRTCQH